MKQISSIVFLLVYLLSARSQDTFSIVAADSTSREVGSAGASCLDLFAFGFDDPSFLGDLIPDTGAINSQSFYLVQNQNNARLRMRTGDTPAQIISWLVQNDVEGNPHVRQYGIAGFAGNQPAAAGFTGENCFDYKNHITGHIDGIHYAIQGNILQGQHILDSMEARFRNATGDLACRLMAALQGAAVVGADTRCTGNATSSLFAFVKVAQPDDPYGAPSFIRTVATRSNAGIEPIDSLQSLFDLSHSCQTTGIRPNPPTSNWHIQPNPAHDQLYLHTTIATPPREYQISDSQGRLILHGSTTGLQTQIHIHQLPPGWYTILLEGNGHKAFVKIK